MIQRYACWRTSCEDDRHRRTHRTQVLVWVPPVGGTGGGAAVAENALVQPVKFGAVLGRLQILLLVVCVGRRLLHEPGLDGGVLLVRVGLVDHEVSDHEHMGKGAQRRRSTSHRPSARTSAGPKGWA